MKYWIFALLVLLRVKTTKGVNTGDRPIDVRDGQNKTIECSIGQTITIFHAEYGNPDTGLKDNCKRTFDVRSNVSHCGGKRSCWIAPNQFVRDPCPGVEKWVHVKYRCVDGPSTNNPMENITVHTSNSGLEDDRQTEEPTSMPVTPTEEPAGIDGTQTEEPMGTEGPKTNETADFSNKEYDRVPGNLPNVATVNLSGNMIDHLSTGVFANIKNCRSLDLENNRISVIKAGAFKHLTQLKTLTLSGNPLKEIKGNMWKGLRALVNIRIRGLPANITLRHQAFSNLPQLHKVDLDLQHLKKYSSFYINSTNFPDTPNNQVKFRIELQGVGEITCDNSFCFLNNMQKKGLIGGFTSKGEKIDEPICKIDQNPFWNYSSANCDSLGQNGKGLSKQAIYGIIAIAGSVLLIVIVLVWCKCTRTGRRNIEPEEQQPTDLETNLPDQLTRKEELIDELTQSQRFSSLILAHDVEEDERYVMA